MIENKYKWLTRGAIAAIALNVSFWLFLEVSKLYKDAEIELLNPIVEVGEVQLGDTVKPIFRFANQGKVDLMISNVIPDCDCTLISDYSNRVLPDEKCIIQAKYVAVNPGPFVKKVVISYNSSNSPAYVVFRGFVK
jgi:hypothetical protein